MTTNRFASPLLTLSACNGAWWWQQDGMLCPMAYPPSVGTHQGLTTLARGCPLTPRTSSQNSRLPQIEICPTSAFEAQQNAVGKPAFFGGPLPTITIIRCH